MVLMATPYFEIFISKSGDLIRCVARQKRSTLDSRARRNPG